MVGPKRTATIVDTGVRKPLDLKIHVPVESMVEPESMDLELDPFAGQEATRKSIWPAIYPELLKLVKEHTLDADLRQQPARGRAAGAAAERARRGADRPRAPRLAGPRGAADRRGACSRPASCRAWWRRSSLELGIDMGAVDLVLQVESPKSVTAGLQRIGRAGHNVGDTSKGRIFPKFRADLLECAVVAQRMREGQDRDDGRPAQPAGRARAADRRDGGDRRGVAARRGRARGDARPHLHVLRAVAPAARERPGHARRPLPERGVRRAAAAHRVGPRERHDPRPQGLARAGHHQRGHDPGPRPVLREPPGRPPRRRARRGDGLRGAAGPDVPARRVVVADRGDHARPRDRHARAGRAGRGPVLEGRRARPPARAGRGDRRVRALGRRPGAGGAGARATTSTRRPRSTSSSSCASSRRRRGSSRATGRS